MFRSRAGDLHTLLQKLPVMKKIIGILALAALSTGAFAQDSTSKKDDTPWDYIMMKNGQMIEVTHGHQSPVTKDVILVNETTIHADGTINVSSGRTKHLKEGEYITMDGRIRKLKSMGT
jgi:hypothetical protein